MSTTINSKAVNTKPVTAMMDTVSTKTASYYENKYGYGSSYYYGDGYSYNYNAYPTTKKTHGFEAVLPEDFKNILKMEQPKLKTFLYNLLKEKGYVGIEEYDNDQYFEYSLKHLKYPIVL